jgi:iron-sulfur cluster repair protein YtfE (RIC family)
VDYKLDMSMMLALHDGLRRDLERVGRLAAQVDGGPAGLLRATVGWELFKQFLVSHHQSEDEALWPALRAAVIAHPDQLALVDALEAEHAVIGPLLAAVDASTEPKQFADIVDELVTKLSAHLKHEEADGLPLIDTTLTPGAWLHFVSVNTERNRPDAAKYLPWLLDRTAEPARSELTGKFPPPMLTALREQWLPAYAALDAWKER